MAINYGDYYNSLANNSGIANTYNRFNKDNILPLNQSENISGRFSNPMLETVGLPNPNFSPSGVSGLGNRIGGFLSSPTGAVGLGAITGLVGGFLGNQQIKSSNAGLQKGINTLESQLNDLRKQREEATQYRKGEATDFLTNYVTARDPNRSAQISQMYATGQDRYRNELQNNDAMQNQVNSNIAQLRSQKQKEMGGLEIVGQGLVGAAQMIPFALMG